MFFENFFTWRTILLFPSQVSYTFIQLNCEEYCIVFCKAYSYNFLM